MKSKIEPNFFFHLLTIKVLDKYKSICKPQLKNILGYTSIQQILEFHALFYTRVKSVS